MGGQLCTATNICGNLQEVPGDPDSVVTALREAKFSADAIQVAWAKQATANDIVEWERFTSLLDKGVPLPEPREDSRIGGPAWLAKIICTGAKVPDEVIDRVRWSANRIGGYFHHVDEDGTNLTMALAQELGDGPWLDYFFDRGLLSKQAKDRQGRTVLDYAQMKK